ASVNQMAFCHECAIEIRPLMTPEPTCPRCNGQFVELIEDNAASRPQDFDPVDEANDQLPGIHFLGGDPPNDLGGLLSALLTSAAAARRGPPPSSNNNYQQPSSPGQNDNSNRSSNSDSNRSTSGSYQRSGATSFGPFGVQWNYQYGSGGADPYRSMAEQQQRNQHPGDGTSSSNPTSPSATGTSNVRTPSTLSNFLRFAFGSDPQQAAMGGDAEPGSRRTNDNDDYFHDDGMGGAGGAADGRNFNHDNRGRYHQPPSSPPLGGSGAAADLPPELAGLRNLFAGLFGGESANGGTLFDLLVPGGVAGGAGGGGPRGQWGDYVFGQQGLDDIISQLMEQTQGSNAPPPASDEEIEKLEKFTLADKDRIMKAKNQDCPTCKEDFLPSGDENAESNMNVSEDADPPEETAHGDATADKQQEELISMPCAHIFHLDCLVPWLKLHGTCPVCRISIVKPRDGSGNNPNGGSGGGSRTGSGGGSNQQGNGANSAAGSTSYPSGSGDTSSFGSSPNMPGAFPATNPGGVASSSVFHPSPSGSTTVTSTVYTAPLPATASSPAGAGGMHQEVFGSIVSSPPLVSDRETEADGFFTHPIQSPSRFGPDQSQTQHAHSLNPQQDMRDTLRRAAESRIASQYQHQQQQRQRPYSNPFLEPDELD
ncbi:hypothetical protein BCV70DRAFT_141635, partial [Testicularia cyperi]